MTIREALQIVSSQWQITFTNLDVDESVDMKNVNNDPESSDAFLVGLHSDSLIFSEGMFYKNIILVNPENKVVAVAPFTPTDRELEQCECYYYADEDDDFECSFDDFEDDL